MAKQNSPRSIILFAIALGAGVAMSVGLQAQARAESAQELGVQIISSTKNIRVKFDPPGPGKPGETAGGASRGNPCPQEQVNAGGCVTPLMPANREGLTVTERPTFLVYVPETSAKQVFFSLVDESRNYQYQKKISLPGKGGIVSFKLPDDAPALEVGKNYQWTFILMGEQELRPDSPGVQGEIRRVELNQALSAQLQQVTPIERAALYGKEGIWYETVGTLAELVRSQPGDAALADTWKQLLSSVGLEAIAAQPLVQ